jgi:hypothetical protein
MTQIYERHIEFCGECLIKCLENIMMHLKVDVNKSPYLMVCLVLAERDSHIALRDS